MTPCINKFTFLEVTEVDVIKVTKTINSMSVGDDNINSFIIKFILNGISGPLAHIICLNRTSFPDC